MNFGPLSGIFTIIEDSDSPQFHIMGGIDAGLDNVMLVKGTEPAEWEQWREPNYRYTLKYVELTNREITIDEIRKVDAKEYLISAIYKNGEKIWETPYIDEVIHLVGKFSDDSSPEECYVFINGRKRYLDTEFDITINNTKWKYGEFKNSTTSSFFGTNIESISVFETTSTPELAGLFYNCTKLKDISGLEYLDTSECTSFKNIFYNCTSINSFDPIRSWNTESVTSLEYSFYKCTSIETLEALFDWNVSKVNTLAYAFGYCSKLQNLNGLEKWNILNVKNLGYAFTYCTKLNQIDALRDWKTTNVTSIERIFSNCTNLDNLDGISEWDVSNVTNMQWCFQLCKWTNANAVAKWNVEKVIQMNHVFYDCTSLRDIEALSNWNPKSATTLASTLNQVKMTNTEMLKDWDTGNVTAMTHVFWRCTALIDASEIKNWNVSKVTSLGNLFNGCTNLETVEFNNWDVTKCTTFTDMFINCSKLINIKGTINNISGDFSLAPCPLVSSESIDVIIDGLKEGVTNKTLTFNSSTGLTDEQKQKILNKGWQIAYK